MEAQKLGTIKVEFFWKEHPVYGRIYERHVYYNDELVHKDIKNSRSFWQINDELQRFWLSYDMEAPQLPSKQQCQCSGNCRCNSRKRFSFFGKCRLKFFKLKLKFMKIFFKQELNPCKTTVIK